MTDSRPPLGTLPAIADQQALAPCASTTIPLTCALCGDAFAWDMQADGTLPKDGNYHTCRPCRFGTTMCHYYGCPTIYFRYRRKCGAATPMFCSDRCRGDAERAEKFFQQRGEQPPTHYRGTEQSIRCGTESCSNRVWAHNIIPVGVHTPVYCSCCSSKKAAVKLASQMKEIEERKQRRATYRSRTVLGKKP